MIQLKVRYALGGALFGALFALSLHSTLCLAAPRPISFVALRSEPVPLAFFRSNTLEGGILKDLGEAIAEKLHTTAVFVTIPRLRIDDALARGEVDAICDARPEWYGSRLNWSAPIFVNANVLIMRNGATAVSRFEQLRGKTVGGVFGYVYPDLDAQVGGAYRRDDAPTMVNSIMKLQAGHIDYAVVNKITFDWELRTNPELRSFPALTIRQYQAQCGFSPAGNISFAQASRAVDELIKDGTVERILARYR